MNYHTPQIFGPQPQSQLAPQPTPMSMPNAPMPNMPGMPRRDVQQPGAQSMMLANSLRSRGGTAPPIPGGSYAQPTQ